MKQNRIVAWILILSLVLGIGTVTTPIEVQAEKVKVKNIKIDEPYEKKVIVAKGKKIQLSATVSVSPNTKSNKKVSFVSTKKKIATVSKSGVIKAKKVGTTKIIITSKKNKKKKTKVTVKVVKYPVQRVSFDKTSISLNLGDKTFLKTTIKARKGANRTVYWTTSDANIVSVSQWGFLIAKHPGTAKIEAKAIDGSNKKAVCMVKVNEGISPTNAPVTTKAPIESIAPTEVPKVTNTPEVTKAPDATNTPEITKTPEITQCPSATPTVKPTVIPSVTPSVAPESVVNIESVTVENDSVLSFCIDQEYELDAADIQVMKKRNPVGTYQYEFSIEDVITEDNKTYQIVFSDEAKITTGDYIQVSLPSLYSAKEISYVQQVEEFQEDTKYIKATKGKAISTQNIPVWREYDENLTDTSRDHIVGMISYEITGLPSGITHAAYLDYGVTVSGTPEETGIFNAVITAKDEAGNTFIRNCVFYVGSEDVIAAPDMEIYWASEDADANGIYTINATGGSGKYTYSVEENQYGIVLSENNSKAIEIPYQEPGDYTVEVAITDKENAELTTSMHVKFHVIPTKTFTGKVVDKQGNPVSGAKVIFFNTDKTHIIKPRESITETDGTFSCMVPTGTYDLKVYHEYSDGTTYVLGKEISESDVELSDITLPIYPVTIEVDEGKILRSTAEWYNDLQQVIGIGTNFWVKKGNYQFYSYPVMDDFLVDTVKKIATITVEDSVLVELSYEDIDTEITQMTSDSINVNIGTRRFGYVSYTPDVTGTHNISITDIASTGRGIVLYDSDGNILSSKESSYTQIKITHDLTAGSTYYIATYWKEPTAKITSIPLTVTSVE